MSSSNQAALPDAAADAVYLKREVKMEPLVCRWYAWSHLIAPAQLALHLNYRILPLLQNFADNPSVHVSANLDPDMYGGPFVELAESDVARVRQLIADTRAACPGLLQLGEELRAFDTLLQENATGYSLHEFYDKLPASLRGMVELVYDLHHRPSFRFFEAMLYASGIARDTQEVMLHHVAENDRDFFMSTPRLESPDSLFLKIPFADARLDTLAQMRSTPHSFDAIRRLLGIDDSAADSFRQFFTPEPPRMKPGRHFDGDGVRVRYFGHACVLFETAEVAVLFDPFVSIEDAEEMRFTINDLPDTIDYVIISHAHQDHFSAEMLIQLRHRIRRVVVPANNSGSIADPSLKLTLNEIGFFDVDVVDCYDRIAIPGGAITSLPFTGEHADLPIFSKHGILLELQDKKFMFLVDSDGRDIMLYRRMMEKIGPIDALFIGMECVGAPLNWLYEPLLARPINRRNNESRRLSGADSARAANILAEVKAPRVFVYAMGQEPWMECIMGLQYTPDSTQLTEADKFVAECNASAIPAERLYLHREVVFLDAA